MSYIDQDDGLTKLSRGEHYRVSGYVTVKVFVAFETSKEPGEDEDELWSAIEDVVGDDFDLIDSEDLDYEIEVDE